MPRTNELSEDLRERIVDLHKAGKGYKSISKSLDIHRSTVRKIVDKWRRFSTVANFHRSGRPVKMTARAQRRMLSEVKKNPRVSAKDLQKSLAQANIFVDKSTISKSLNKNGVRGRAPRKFAKEHLDVDDYGQNIPWTDEIKVEFMSSAGDWKKRCEDEWSLQGTPMPDSVDWKSVYEAKPFGRNLLKNPSPYGLTTDGPPPEPDLPEVPDRGPPRFTPEGDSSGWTISSAVLPCDTSGIPQGSVIYELPHSSWFTMEQVVDLKAEGLWEELLDEFQPEIVIQDWYMESQLLQFIYQLHVKLLGADKTVIAEHAVNPSEALSVYSHNWKEVSHVFSGYGPGVRYVHFVHRLKNQFLNGFWNTMFTGSSVTVNPKK